MEVQPAPAPPNTGSAQSSASITSDDRKEGQEPDQHDSSPTRASPAHSASVGLTLCSVSLMYILVYGVVQIVWANYCTGVFLILGAVLSLYYIGRSLRAPETSPVNDIPVVSPGAEWKPPASGELLAFKATVVVRSEPGERALETLTRPIMVVPAAKLLAPARWLVVRRADGFQWSYPMPDIPSNHGWFFVWGNFYLRRDVRGHYACAGHPDDRIADEDAHRLFEGTTIKMGKYTLTIAVTEPTTVN